MVFVRHGFGPQIGRLNLHEHIPLVRRILAGRAKTETKELSREQRLTDALQELGPTFVKLGQILSARPDIVGEALADELKRLRDQVKPFDSAVARAIIEREFRLPISEVFTSFDDTPIAAGSIAQVHPATLKDGTRVMVKVRRPNIESVIMADIGILRFAARMAEPQFPEIRPTQIVDEFERSIRNELDFTVEATNTTRFHEMMKECERIHSPSVFWRLTTSAVLTIERLSGISIGDIAEIERRGLNRPELARRIGECFLTQYFRVGTFHADPHAGNILVDDDGTIGIIDFGNVGHLSYDLKSMLSTILIAAVKEEIDYLAETAAEISIIGDKYDERQFKRDLGDLYHKYRGMPLGQINMRQMFREVTRMARQNDMALPRDLVLLGKSMATISTVTRALDPTYDVVMMSAPKTEEFFRERLSPKRLAARTGLEALSLLRFAKRLPHDIRSIIRKAEAGQFQIAFQHRGLDRAVGELERASNRLAISIYVAALFVASSLIIRTNFLSVYGVSVPGIMGYMLGGLLSLWLAWGILRSGRL